MSLSADLGGLGITLGLLRQGVSVTFSPQDLLDGDAFTAKNGHKYVSGPVPQTLSGLVAQIMTERKQFAKGR
jgi:hypothetical protein